MAIKRIIVFAIICCLLLGTPVNAGMKTHWLRASGKYEPLSMSGKNFFKDQLKWSNLSKKQKKAN